MPLKRVLIANRGEIAVRVIRACQALGLKTVLATSEADRQSLPAQLADRVVCIGPAAASKSYLNAHAVVAAALGTGCDALHPGYGFLSESSRLAALCNQHGVTFVGPRPEHIQQMGNKLAARALARQFGVPVLPGSEKVSTADDALTVANDIGLPIMMKAAAGGGGRGMKIVTQHAEMADMFTAASAEALSAFGDNTLYLERYISNARHIEVQVLGDRFGHVIHLGERDCSLQRRHQKIVEESPAPGVPPALRDEICDSAARLARSIGYESAGTVEFIYDEDAKRYYFLEMNTRIQVEHPVTEAVTGIDLVQEQFRIASGEKLRLTQQDVTFTGHAIECRITAEVPQEGFRPSPGLITRWQPPAGDHVRLDTHCYEGYLVPINYDSLLAKLIVHGKDRDEALGRMRAALESFRIEGIGTILPFLMTAMTDKAFAEGRINTALVGRLIDAMDLRAVS